MDIKQTKKNVIALTNDAKYSKTKVQKVPKTEKKVKKCTEKTL